MLAIRLQRLGKKKQPTYRLVVSEKARDTQGRALEILGHYNPLMNPSVISFKKDRVLHWISVGAQPSDTVHNLLVKEGIISSDKKRKSVQISKKRRVKLDEKSAAEVEAKKAAKEKAAEEATAKAEAKKAEAAKAAEVKKEPKAEEPAKEEPKVEEPKAEAPAEEDHPKGEKKDDAKPSA